jgi:hypothetical protein
MKKIMLLYIFFGTLLFCSCSKSNDTEPEGELIFHSLVSEKDTIAPGEQAKITATATGTNLEYVWSADAGLLNATSKPNQVLFSAGECELGNRKITCKVAVSSKQWESKDVYVFVYE